jgi:hypothetical protein
MTDGNQLTRNEQALLVEYQVCHQDSRSLAAVHWTVASIFFAVNGIALGFIAKILSENNNTYRNQWIILAFALTAIVTLMCLWLWLNRVNFLMRLDNRRMDEIEQILHMRMGAIRDALDIREVRRIWGREIAFWPLILSEGAWPIKIIYSIFISLWLATIAGAFIIDC